jgi:hypothetical protein
VRSCYSAPWQGKVLSVITRSNGLSPLLKVKQLIDRTGRPIASNLQIVVTRSSLWFKKLEEVD